MVINKMSSAEFFYTWRSNVIRCAFCSANIGSWREGDAPIIEHLRLSPSCGSAKGLNTASRQNPRRNNDVHKTYTTYGSNSALLNTVSTFLKVYLFILMRIIIFF
jgi:hypothetical protein